RRGEARGARRPRPRARLRPAGGDFHVPPHALAPRHGLAHLRPRRHRPLFARERPPGDAAAAQGRHAARPAAGKPLKKLALFDLDNTLLDGDSDYEWAQFLIEEGVLHADEYNAKNDWFYERYKDGTLDIHEFLDFQLKPIARRPRAQLDAWHSQFMQRRIRPIILPKAPELLARHGDALTAIVTATNRFITQPIASELGVSNLLATDIEEGPDGVFTGKPRG